MQMPLPLIVGVAALSLTAAGCSKNTNSAAVASADQPCGALIAPNAEAAAKLPAGFPTVAGFVATYTVTQGKTVLVRGAVAGRPSDIVAERDRGLATIRAQGYQVTGSDQEPGFEADGDFTGPHPGDINVKTLCKHYLEVNYSFG